MNPMWLYCNAFLRHILVHRQISYVSRTFASNNILITQIITVANGIMNNAYVILYEINNHKWWSKNKTSALPWSSVFYLQLYDQNGLI